MNKATLQALLLVAALASSATAAAATYETLANYVPAAWVDEAFGWYRNLLMIDSAIDPMPDRESGVVNYVHGVLEANGIPSTVRNLSFAGLRGPYLYARLAGTSASAGAVLLASHSDTVTGATMGPSSWSGTIEGDRIYGRGAIDMKHKVAQDLATLVWTKRLALRHERALVYMVMPAEEIGLAGAFACYYDAECNALLADTVVAFEEVGGVTITSADGTVLMPVGLGDKGPCPVMMTTHNAARHFSAFASQAESATLTMAAALLNGNNKLGPPHYTAANRAFLADLVATGKPYLVTLALLLGNPLTFDSTMMRLRNNDLQFYKIVHHQFVHSRGLYGVDAPPSSASSSAVDGSTEYFLVNIPGDENNCAQAIQELADDINDPLVNLTMISFTGMTAEVTRWLSAGSFVDPANAQVVESMAAIKAAVKGIMKNVTVVRSLCPSPTDATVWTRLFGIPTLAFEPVRMPDDVCYMDLLHSSSEWLPVSGVKESLRVVFDVISRVSHVDLASAPHN